MVRRDASSQNETIIKLLGGLEEALRPEWLEAWAEVQRRGIGAVHMRLTEDGDVVVRRIDAEKWTRLDG